VVRVFMRANTIMKMTRVVTLLFSDKKSEEEEKGAVEWILLHAKKFLKALLHKMQKKSHAPKKKRFLATFRSLSFFRARRKGR
jgi:hypothetical protein